MAGSVDMTEFRRGVLAPCVLALLAQKPRFGLEIVRDLAEHDGLLTSEGTVYPLLTRLSTNRLVTSLWHHEDGQRPRRYYSITTAGLERLEEFRRDWSDFADSVAALLAGTGGASGTGGTSGAGGADQGSKRVAR